MKIIEKYNNQPSADSGNKIGFYGPTTEILDCLAGLARIGTFVKIKVCTVAIGDDLIVMMFLFCLISETLKFLSFHA
jgi:hypothetical protein